MYVIDFMSAPASPPKPSPPMFNSSISFVCTCVCARALACVCVRVCARVCACHLEAQSAPVQPLAPSSFAFDANVVYWQRLPSPQLSFTFISMTVLARSWKHTYSTAILHSAYCTCCLCHGKLTSHYCYFLWTRVFPISTPLLFFSRSLTIGFLLCL